MFLENVTIFEKILAIFVLGVFCVMYMGVIYLTITGAIEYFKKCLEKGKGKGGK